MKSEDKQILDRIIRYCNDVESLLTEYKNDILENLFKIKENQNKKKCFSYWKNNTNLNQLFTFRPRESLNKNNLNIKKPKRQLRVKYIKKKRK